jgi:uncharacterized membrane protein
VTIVLHPVESPFKADLEILRRGDDPPEPRRISRGQVLGAIAAFQVAATVMTLAGVAVPFVSAVIGFAAVVGVPVTLIALARPGRGLAEIVVLSVPLALGALMVTGLAMNTLLPHLGVAEPLALRPVVLGVDVMCLLLGAALRRHYRVTYLITLPTLSRSECRILVASATTVLMAVMGANRLNNDAGGGVTLVMLCVAALVLGVATWRCDRLSPWVLFGAIYLVSLALLLMTSLRGWYITGHDVQREFIVFQLSSSRGIWNMSFYPDAYNACLSITVLPTMLSRWIPIDPAYIFKAIYPLLFAVCPVGVALLAKRFSSTRIAVVSATLFVGFVTFFQDMPMLNRQAIAFLFFIAALLVAFNPSIGLRTRQVWLGVLGIGLVLSHYSTTYMTIGFFVVAFLARQVARVVAWVATRLVGRDRASSSIIGRRVAGSPLDPRQLRAPAAISIVPIVVIAAFAFVWAGPLTHTDRGLVGTVSSVVDSIRGDGDNLRSNDAAYGIVGGAEVSPQQRLDATVSAEMRETRKARASGEYYSISALREAPTRAVSISNLPETPLGRAVSRIIPVSVLNAALRQGASLGLQLFLLVGLVVIALGRRRLVRVTSEFYFLACGLIVVIAIQLVAPILTVEYGILRSFQQGLMVFDVFIVAGIAALVPRVSPGKKVAAAAAASLILFLSTTGVIPQLLGGYPPQMHLNNDGLYYEIYYLHPEELAATGWLRDRTAVTKKGDIQAEVQTDRYTFTRFQSPQQLSPINDILPPLLRTDSYVFLGYSNVTRSQSTTAIASDLVTYEYPIRFLDEHKDLVYSTDGSRVYR